ncbi:hypothetical protein AURDEDRAFT_64378, partial [Auricularia subglabra TFB-10046 SS5]
PPVSVHMENTIHYGLRASDEWRLLSPNGGIVFQDGRQYVLSMFHQLRCLDVLRQAVVREPRVPLNDTAPVGSRVRRCMNYMHQMILCRTSARIEVVTAIRGPHSVIFDKDYMCNDWSLIYDVAAESYRETVSTM